MTQNNTIAKVEVKKGYFESGALYSETPYVNGKKHGIEKCYYKSGVLEWEVPYVNGKRHGIATFYSESGALEWEIPYVNEKVHGVEKHYDTDKLNIDCLALYEKGHEVTSVKFSIKGDRS